MQPELITIDNLESVLELQAYLADKDVVAYDSETTGLTSRHEVIGFSVCAEEDRAYYVVLAKWQNGSLVFSPDRAFHDSVKTLIRFLANKKLVMHNGVFDCAMAEAYFKIRLIESLHTDTMILAHLLDENRSCALKVLAQIMYGESSIKEQQEMRASVLANGGVWLEDNKEMYKADYQILAKYGAKDAWLTRKLFYDLVPQLADQGLIEFFYEDESMPLLRTATYDLNTEGMTVDTAKLSALKATLKAEIAEAIAFINNEIAPRVAERWLGTNKKNTFKISSPSQLSELVFGIYNLEFGLLTKGGKAVCKHLGLKLPYTRAQKRIFIAECTAHVGEYLKPPVVINGKKKGGRKIGQPWKYLSVDAKTLEKVSSSYKWIERYLDYQKKQKILGTYVEGVESRIDYGVVKSSYLQHGTKTGRYSSKNPNLQNLPRDDQRVKHCYVPRPGKVFVAADYSQLEPRTFASYSQDPPLMDAFKGPNDFYSVVGVGTLSKYDCVPSKEELPNSFRVMYKHLRNVAKEEALAFAYGALDRRISQITGRSIEDTADDREQYFTRFPGVKKMMLEAHDLAKESGYVENMFGRKRRLPEAKSMPSFYKRRDHEDLPYELRKVLNQACNFRIQSTGASIVNRACIAFYEAIKIAEIDCKIVSQIHDEIVVEAWEKDAETVSMILQYCMENTVQLNGVPLEAIPRISKTLAK